MTFAPELALATSSTLALICPAMGFFFGSRRGWSRSRNQESLSGKIPSDCCKILEDVTTLNNHGVWFSIEPAKPSP